MKTYRAIIVDDERLARVTLKDMLSEYPVIEIIGETASVEESIPMILDLNPDVLFLDIQLSDGTGFDLLNKINYSGKVVFVTAYDEFAVRAFEVNAIHYLLKPISHRHLGEAIERLETKESEKGTVHFINFEYNDRLLITAGSSLNFIKISSIEAITAVGDYSLIRTDNGKEFLDSKTMSEWEQRLPENHFLRINRSAIINFDAIEKTEQKSSNLVLVTLKGFSEPIRVSRLYYKKLKLKYS
ncbi:MAG: LytTR family DNA-binding domain-containing protein [Bacteroidota bacterium]